MGKLPQFPKQLLRSGPMANDFIFGNADDVKTPVPHLRVRAEGYGEIANRFDSATRRELLASVRSGDENSLEIEIDFRAFQQVPGQMNRNFLRFRKGILGKLARSFRGVPLLRDHSQESIDARAGTITKSAPVKLDNGGTAFDMTARVTAQWAVEAVLAGNLDRFSIGWDHPGLESVHCSECACPIFTECSHFPGDVLKDDDSEPRTVEFVFQSATGVEVSGVNVPAVVGTEINDIRTALSLAMRPPEKTPSGEDMSEIAKALRLQAGADEETILAAIEARDATAKANASALAAAQAKLGAYAGEIEQLQAELAKATERERATEIDRLMSENANKFPAERDSDGNTVTSGLETSLRALASKDLEAVKPILASLPVQTLAGAPAQTKSVDRKGVHASAPISAILADQLKQAGVSPEDYAKYNPETGTDVPRVN